MWLGDRITKKIMDLEVIITNQHTAMRYFL